MKVAYFTTRFPFYSETFIREEIDQISDHGNEVVVVNLDGYNMRQDEVNYRIINNSRNPITLIWYILLNAVAFNSLFFSIKRIKHIFKSCLTDSKNTFKYIYLLFSLDYLSCKLKKEEVDLVVLHFLFKSTLAGYLISQHLHKNYHLRLHTKFSVLSYSTCKDIIFGAHKISAIAKNTSEYFLNKYHIDSPIEVIRQSVNVESLLKINTSYEQTYKHSLIAIGRLVEKKGFHYLIDSINQLDKNTQQKIKLSIYGTGPMEAQLQSLINEKGLNDKISLEGSIPHNNLMEILKEAYLLIVPSVETASDIDGIPTVIPEAMALRTPVLATSVAGIPEMIIDDYSGFLCEAGNAYHMCQKLKSILNNYLEPSIVNNAFSKVIMEYKASFASKLYQEII